MLSFSSAKVFQRLLTPVLILWVSGAGCLLGCGNMSMAIEHSPAATLANVVVAGDACASAHSHDGCMHHGAMPAAHTKKAQSPANDAVAAKISGTSSLMESCPLAVNATAALSKARPDQSGAQTAAVGSLEFISRPDVLDTAFLKPLRVPNRGHTYLRCCAFLI